MFKGKALVERLINSFLIAIVAINAVIPTAVYAKVARGSDVHVDSHKGKAFIKDFLRSNGIYKFQESAPKPYSQEGNKEGPVITVALKATPDTLQPDGKISIYWEIEGLVEKELDGVSLIVAFPVGFEPEKELDGIFDAQSGLLTIKPSKLGGSMQVFSKTAIENDAFFSAVLLDNKENLIAAANLIIPLHDQFQIAGHGGGRF